MIFNEKSTTRQILTAGISKSTEKTYLKIQFKEDGIAKFIILDADCTLDTVYKNLEPILERIEPPGISNLYKEEALFCQECGSKVPLDSKFCANCGKKIEISVQRTAIDSSIILEKIKRDYVLREGDKTVEEKREEEKREEEMKVAEQKSIADARWQKQISKAQAVFDVKYLGGHITYPTKKPRDAKIGIFVDRIEIQTDKFETKIPYDQINRIENMDEKKYLLFG